MKLPIRRVKNTVPPKFMYHQIISTPHGELRAIEYVECVSSTMESALCDLLKITEQLAEENKRLKDQLSRK